jgi:hypothetical protein
MTAAVLVSRLYKRTQERLLKLTEDLDDDQLQRRFQSTNSIAFNVWHCARWADHLQSILPLMTDTLKAKLAARDEIWTAERIAVRWRFPAAQLGHAETGMGMDEGVSAAMPMPSKTELLGYARRAFVAASSAVVVVDDADLALDATVAPERRPWSTSPDAGTVGSWILVYYEHDNRHLGMIECQRGLLGVRGSATA